MVVSVSPSTVTVPRENPEGFVLLLDFLDARFPWIGRQEWVRRINASRVIQEDKTPFNISSPLIPGSKVLYYREVETEPLIPFKEEILFHNDHLIAACKPHFLPVVPSGPHVNETLLNRLKIRFSNPDIVPIHRLDRETAGVVLFSVEPETRGAFQHLFMEKKVKKTYEAVTRRPGTLPHLPSVIVNRIERGEPWFRNTIVPGRPNAETRLELVGADRDRAFFRLYPQTGKKHQLRLHLASLGFPIENDRCYPDLLPKQGDDWEHPLMLLSREVRFMDPIAGRERVFTSPRWVDPLSDC
ncbi:RluD2 [Desulforapulum autotrophicum HRM2]|uniref:RluD2 n=1 Tax=Desulforapulum autotrophicum (strain ATCC 43914 / DSM 3382 / VKM B-1955 / HRM2) TaxID=177437 RepID=C0QI10_DESAH|nr:pseudouridine synthase [Desulforapulum autotrophicum]ACN15746.1 RluD2 [Desulforapulum autotrophicum HRM2]